MERFIRSIFGTDHWMYLWFWGYRRWTWPAAVIVLLIVIAGIVFLIRTSGFIFAGGGGWFKTSLLLGLIGIGIYRAVRGEMPPVWITSVVIAAPLFMWGFWTVKPEWYLEWRNSRYFFWMIASTAALGWLASYGSNSVAGTARAGLLSLMVLAIGIGAYGKWKEYYAKRKAEKETAEIALLQAAIDTLTLLPGDTLRVEIKGGTRVRTWYNPAAIDTTYLVPGGLQDTRIIVAKPGGSGALIKICRHPYDKEVRCW